MEAAVRELLQFLQVPQHRLLRRKLALSLQNRVIRPANIVHQLLFVLLERELCGIDSQTLLGNRKVDSKQLCDWLGQSYRGERYWAGRCVEIDVICRDAPN